MFDKALFEKICNVTCTFVELKRFNSKIDEKAFDTDNCFRKYYSLDSILKCIQLYRDKRITDKYLAYWCNAYNWIIMGGFKGKENDEKEKDIDAATILIWDMSDCLDSLSFFDAEFYDLNEYISNFRILDSIYKNHKKWEKFYSFNTDTYDNDEPINDINVLFVSKTKNVYYTLASDGCDFKKYVLDKELTETQDIDTIISDLKTKGYKELAVSVHSKF